ncbi:MAG TPA: nitroreductase family protein [Anaerolineales bacterium]|nr:nitroreductase family protein [Anaerolineales bacterium]
MKFSDVIQARQSVRSFLPDPIPEPLLQKILSCLACVPSAGNLQAYEILRLRKPDLKARLGEATTACAAPVRQAPIALIFIANAFRSGLKYQERGINLFCVQDATIAATYVMLAAVDHGLATLWIGGFNTAEVSTLLELKPGLWPVVIMPIGFPAEVPERRARRSLQDVVHDLD